MNITFQRARKFIYRNARPLGSNRANVVGNEMVEHVKKAMSIYME